jgi:hypothetical protein
VSGVTCVHLVSPLSATRSVGTERALYCFFPDVATLKIFACVIDGTTVLSLRVITGLRCVWVEHVYCSESVGRVVVAVTVEVSTFYDRKFLPVRICRAKRI